MRPGFTPSLTPFSEPSTAPVSVIIWGWDFEITATVGGRGPLGKQRRTHIRLRDCLGACSVFQLLHVLPCPVYNIPSLPEAWPIALCGGQHLYFKLQPLSSSSSRAPAQQICPPAPPLSKSSTRPNADDQTPAGWAGGAFQCRPGRPP
jgi:hypothetical protein